MTMQITIDCPRCNAAKRPLRTCAACGAPGRVAEIDAWRRRLHSHHMGVIMAEPRRAPAGPIPLPRPLRVVVALDELVEATETLIVPDTVAPPSDPLSFDWRERRGLRRRRRTA
jgi:hypothetical protein